MLWVTVVTNSKKWLKTYAVNIAVDRSFHGSTAVLDDERLSSVVAGGGLGAVIL